MLLGEASHGSRVLHWRTEICAGSSGRRGSVHRVEGDWPDCYRVNRYVKGFRTVAKRDDVLHAFERWPTGWANLEVVALCDGCASINDAVPRARRIGLYGLDVYSLWESMTR